MSASKNQAEQDKHSKDEQFEVLEVPPSNIKQQVTEPSAQAVIKKQQPAGNLIQDELLKQDKQRDSINLCIKCSRCLQLEEQLVLANQDKETLKDNFTQLCIQLEELKRTERKRKQSSVEKTQLNFAVDSLKEIIKTYEEENQRLSKFIYETMNITPKEGSKSAVKVVQSVVTDFRTNWFEINKELSELLILSSPSGQGEQPKHEAATYNYYETSAKIEKIKQNVITLLKSAG